MILRGLKVDGFGVHRDLSLDGFEAGLNVVYGENEAGKSTLLQFLRAILYGFDERKRGQDRYEPDGGGAHGGSVTLELEPGSRIRVSRHFRAGRKALGDLVVEDASGVSLDADATLRRALGNSSRALFESIFAIALDDMRSIHAEGIREHIYGAGMTGRGASLPAAMADLRKRYKELLPMGAKGGRIGKLLDEIGELRQRADELARLPDEHRTVVARIAELAEKIRALDEALPAARAARTRTERLARAAEPFAAMMELPAPAAEAPVFPAAGEERLKDVTAAIDRAKSALERAVTRRDETKQRLERATWDAALVERAPEIDAFHAESDRRLGNDAPGLARAKAKELGVEHGKKLDALGSEWGPSRVAAFDASAESERVLLAAADRASASETTAREARRDADLATQSENRDREEIARLVAEVERIGDAEEKADRLEKRVLEFEKTLDEEKAAQILWKDIERRRASAGTMPDAQAILEGTRRANRIVFAAAAVAAAAAIALLLMREPIAAAALFVAALVVVVWAVRRVPVALPASGPGGREVEEVRLRLQRAKQAHFDRAKITFDRSDAGEEDAHRARSEIGDLRAQAKRKAEAERILGERKADLARSARVALEKKRIATAAEGEWDASKRALREWLETHGLPASTSHESARTTLLAVREVQDAGRARSDAEVEVERLEKAAREFAERAGALLSRMGRTPPGPDGDATVVHASLTSLREASLAARKTKDEKARDEADLPRAEADVETARAELAEAEAALTKLFGDADVRDLDGFRARAEEAARWRETKEARDRGEAKVRAALGDEDSDAARDALRRTPREELARGAGAAEAEVARLEREREEAVVERTRAETDRERMENETGLAKIRAAEETAREDLARAAESWQTLVIAEWLLDRARRTFEAEHQPGILRAGGRYLETITRGRWTAIRSVPDEARDEDRLRVVRFDDPEKLHRVETLSRGTMEQLYLALRLALASEFPDPSVRLPLILDDVLVNFSGSRRAAAAEAIASISTRVQVIAFTCHAEMRDALLKVKARGMELTEPARPDEAARKKGKSADRQLRLY